MKKEKEEEEDGILAEFGSPEISAITPTIIEVLEWCESQDTESQADIENRTPYTTLFHGNEGVYYLVMEIFDDLQLIECGISLRHPWLTDKGRKLLNELRSQRNQGDSHEEDTGTD